jgi:hypothetical protein
VLFAPTHIVGITQRPCTMTKCLNTGGIALRVEPTGAKIVRPLLATVRGDNVRLRANYFSREAGLQKTVCLAWQDHELQGVALRHGHTQLELMIMST